MKFRTEYEATPDSRQLSPEIPVVLIGSCFTDYIGERMRRCRWRAYPNVTGTLFNPASIAEILSLAALPETPQHKIEESISQRTDQLWVTWLADSGCSGFSRDEVVENLNRKILRLRRLLSEAKVLIVTFGTAWVYDLADRQGYTVTNCHKFPSNHFQRRRLSVEEITSTWYRLMINLRNCFPELRVIFTVSPVRHLKDGFEGNSVSKAILQIACEKICNFDEKSEYFPSYEIMMDDLRDYRFYSSDLVHPSEEAIDYIWEKFQDRYLSPASRLLLKEGEKVTKRLNHRPLLGSQSEMAAILAEEDKRKSIQQYESFIQSHPSMLRIDDDHLFPLFQNNI